MFVLLVDEEFQVDVSSAVLVKIGNVTNYETVRYGGDKQM